jgi:hypothetical protein
MATDIVNLAAETERNIIDDDAEAALILTNTNASGYALKAENTNATGGTSIDCDSTAGVGIDIDVSGSNEAINALSASGSAIKAYSQATEAHVVDIIHNTAIASATVAPIKIGTSAPSGVVLELNSALISTASLSVIAGAFPVLMTGEDKVVYLVGYEVS